MKALIKNPGDESFREIITENDLKSLQRLVGGYIETVTLATDACVICNEEGRIMGMQPNCNYCGIDFVGPILIVGVDEADFCDCPMSVAMANGGIEQ